MKRPLVLVPVFVAIAFMSVSATIIHIPGDYPTIQEGIDAANEHDTVLVKPGEYVENIDFIGKNIVVASLFLTSGNPEFITSTIIDGDSAGSVVTFASEEDSTATITGFTIQNGYAENGGGIYCLNSNPSIANNIINFNTTYYSSSDSHYGGGIYCYDSSPTIAYNTISHNLACNGGGIYCDYGHPTVKYNVIIENTADP